MDCGAAPTKHRRLDALAKTRKRQLLVESTHKLCLGDLDDNHLLEILLRLPTAKHALICSSVCKKWYRLILSHFFIGRFVTYHMDHDVNYNCNIALDNLASSHEALMLCQNPKFQIKRLDLSSLCEGSEWASILSSCHDLVLCVAKKGGGFRYFICNFLTMQKIAIPVPDDWLNDYPFSEDIGFAFICEPYCARDTQGQCTLSDGYRYRVLRFRADRQSHIYGFPVEVYCSEKPHRWDTIYLLYEGEHEKVHSNLFAYKEKVHWFNGTNIVAYDPFNTVGCYGDTSKGFCIPHPDTKHWHLDVEQRMDVFQFRGIGSCQGRLRFMELGNLYGKEPGDPETACLRVWDLKDYENKEWSMERRVCLYTLASQKEPVSELVANLSDVTVMMLAPHLFDFQQYANLNDVNIRMLAPHPFDEDIVYLSFNATIASCNIRTGELKVFSEFFNGNLMAFSEQDTCAKLITIPWWPTPILQHSQR